MEEAVVPPTPQRRLREPYSQRALANALHTLVHAPPSPQRYNIASQRWGVPLTTLRRRWDKLPMELRISNTVVDEIDDFLSECRLCGNGVDQMLLTPEEEAMLVKWMKEMERICNSVGRYTIESKIKEILARRGVIRTTPIHRSWWARFEKRHPELSGRTANRVAKNRLDAGNRFIIEDHFNKLQELMTDLNITDSGQVLATDEVGFHGTALVNAGKQLWNTESPPADPSPPPLPSLFTLPTRKKRSSSVKRRRRVKTTLGTLLTDPEVMAQIKAAEEENLKKKQRKGQFSRKPAQNTDEKQEDKENIRPPLSSASSSALALSFLPPVVSFLPPAPSSTPPLNFEKKAQEEMKEDIEAKDINLSMRKSQRNRKSLSNMIIE